MRVQDLWEVRGNMLVRVILQPRLRLFTPMETLEGPMADPPPVSLDDIDSERHTCTSSTWKGEQFILDTWDGVSKSTDNRALSEY